LENDMSILANAVPATNVKAGSRAWNY